jgi:hypothetical protein
MPDQTIDIDLGNRTAHEESYIEYLRRRIAEQYDGVILTTGGCGDFDEILCNELHHGGDQHTGLTFNWLAKKWGIPVTALGEIIYDHCKRLEPIPKVTHGPTD